MNLFLSRFFIAGVLAVLTQSIFAENLNSGIYAINASPDPHQIDRYLYLAEDGNIVTGYYNRAYSRPIGPETSAPECKFFLSGIDTGKNFLKLDTWYPLSNGKISKGDQITLKRITASKWTVSFPDEKANFANCDVPTLNSGDEIVVSIPHAWTKIVAVVANKSLMYQLPDPASKPKGYLIQGDPIGVMVQKGNWVNGEYIDRQNDNLTRWFKKDTLIPQ